MVKGKVYLIFRYFFSKNPQMSNPITFSAFTLLFKMCHMPKKDKFGTNS